VTGFVVFCTIIALDIIAVIDYYSLTVLLQADKYLDDEIKVNA